MADSRLTDYLEKRTEVLDRDWTETTCVYRVSIGQRQVSPLDALQSESRLHVTPL